MWEFFEWLKYFCVEETLEFSLTTTAGDREADETKHYAIYGLSLCDNSPTNLIACEATISRIAAFGRLRSDARERTKDIWDYGQQKSNVEVSFWCLVQMLIFVSRVRRSYFTLQILDAAGLGHKYHQSCAERWPHHIRSHRADDPHGAVRHSTKTRRANRLWYGISAFGVHAGRSMKIEIPLQCRSDNFIDRMQVVTLVLYTYFIAALMGRQMVPNEVSSTSGGKKYEDPDLYFPLFTALQVLIWISF